MPLIQFMEALGNNFVIIDAVTQDFNFDKKLIKKLVNNDEYPVFDQILIIEPPKSVSADFSIRIYNIDGSEAENCVNGMRCVAKYLCDQKISVNNKIKLLVKNNLLSVEKINDEFVVENPFSFVPDNIGLKNESHIFSLNKDDQRVECFGVAVGNPHAVIFNDELKLDVELFGNFLQESNIFKNGVNVGFVEVINPDEINLRVYERGVGETQACGSGACAAAVACALSKEMKSEIKINFHQGQVLTKVDVENSKVFLIGKANYRKENVILEN